MFNKSVAVNCRSRWLRAAFYGVITQLAVIFCANDRQKDSLFIAGVNVKRLFQIYVIICA